MAIRHETTGIVAPCPQCEGTGEIDKPEFKGTCLHCDGTGRVVFDKASDLALFRAAPKLLEVVRRALPWLSKAIAENLHDGCAMPHDLGQTANMAQEVYNRCVHVTENANSE